MDVSSFESFEIPIGIDAFAVTQITTLGHYNFDLTPTNKDQDGDERARDSR
jgi:hypothetical protein